VQGESVTRLLLDEHKMKLRYFRHPYLDTGRDLETRRHAEAFLIGRGYRIAPVTLMRGTGCMPASTTTPRSATIPL